MDGCAWTASELARQMGVSPQAMTSCLSKLEESHLITRMRQGRHRYVKLCDEHTAQIVEFMGTVAQARQTQAIGYRQVRADQRLRLLQPHCRAPGDPHHRRNADPWTH
ncbi:helix-turn-helix domain-containing protein [Bifidobacterium sp.]|uniref:helix-turn-helix domain-containing protein n=1 Tax=Bifidobacterium sp. TaxID=41200 RepID=UPI0039EB709A